MTENNATEADEIICLKKSGEDLVEEGIQLIAQGLFRMAENDGLAKAVYSAAAVSSVTSGIHIDLRRSAAREGVEIK